jgi:hypothetical protein
LEHTGTRGIEMKSLIVLLLIASLSLPVLADDFGLTGTGINNIVGLALAAGMFNNSDSGEKIHKYLVETMDGVKVTVFAEFCGMYYNNTIVGCYLGKEWVLIANWDKIKHFREELKGESR